MASKASDIFHEWKYPVLIGLIILGLVFSKWLLSVSQFLILFAVLSDRVSRRKLIEAFKSPVVLAIISVYILHLVGLLWTSDLEYGLKDIRNKIPLISLPVLFFAAGPLKRSTSVNLLLFFVANVLILSIASLINYYISPEIPEQIAIGQSHIRFSLLICLSIAILIHYSDLPYKWYKYSFIPIIIILLYFLFILESFTGYVIMFTLLCLLPLLYKHRIKSNLFRITILLSIFIILSFALWGFISVKRTCFPPVERVQIETLQTHSANNNKYFHNANALISENGNQIYLYIQEEEMIKAWNSRSSKPIVHDSTFISHTNILMRYLSSKGLSKDSVGVFSLSAQDVTNIEHGYTNYLLPDFDPYRKRIYCFLWELQYYNQTRDPSGHSLTQRFEYWKTAVTIIQQHPVFGCGTGDITKAFQQEYERNNSKLKKEFRLRSHNQFLSIAVAFGFVGVIVFLFSIVAPFLFHKIPEYKLYLGFIFIFLLSLLNEDTLETQVGVTFFALFNSFLLFIMPYKNNTEHEKARA